MQTKPAYTDLIAAIARYVHRHLYEEEPRINLPPLRSFDTLCASYYQIPAGVLERVGVMVPESEGSRRYIFTCEPDQFETITSKNEMDGCAYDTVVMAVIELVEFTPRPNLELFEHLAALNICLPIGELPVDRVGAENVIAVDQTTLQNRRDVRANGVVWTIVGNAPEDPPFLGEDRIAFQWTKKKENYDKMFNSWSILLRGSRGMDT